MTINSRLLGQDCAILQNLAAQVAMIAKSSVNRERALLWGKLNELKSVRPLVWINEVPWHEMNVNDELTVQTSDLWAQQLETNFRRTIYQWNHMPADMVVSEFFNSEKIIHDSGFGITEEVDIVKTDEGSEVVSRHFHRQIVEPHDIEKIKMPVVTYDAAASDELYHRMDNLLGSIMPVRKVGIKQTQSRDICRGFVEFSADQE